MKLITKLIAWIILILVILYIAIALALHYFVKPEKYKSYLSKTIYEHTGHKVAFQGAINLTVFPTPGVQVKKLLIESPKNIHKVAPYTANIGEAEVHVALIPLLTGKILPKSVVLKDSTINLVHGNAEKTVFEHNYTLPDPTKNRPTQRDSSTSKTESKHIKISKLNDFTLPTVYIRNANINWIDLRTNTISKLENANLAIHPTQNNLGADIRGKVLLIETHPKRSALLQLRIALSRNSTNTFFKVSDLSFNGFINTEKRKNLKVAFQSQSIVLDLAKQTLNMPQFVMDFAGLKLTGGLTNFWQQQGAGVLATMKSHTKIGNGSITENSKILFPNLGPDQISSKLIFKNIALRPLLTAVADTKNLGGTLNMTADLKTMSSGHDTAVKHLTGTTMISITNAEVYGLNLMHQYHKALSVLREKGADSPPQGRDLFKRLSGNFTIADGIAKTHDLTLVSDTLSGTGAGSTNLVNQTLDYELYLSHSNRKHFKLPLIIRGSWKKPKIHVDLNQIGKETLEKKVKQKVRGLFHDGKLHLKNIF